MGNKIAGQNPSVSLEKLLKLLRDDDNVDTGTNIDFDIEVFEKLFQLEIELFKVFIKKSTIGEIKNATINFYKLISSEKEITEMTNELNKQFANKSDDSIFSLPIESYGTADIERDIRMLDLVYGLKQAEYGLSLLHKAIKTIDGNMYTITYTAKTRMYNKKEGTYTDYDMSINDVKKNLSEPLDETPFDLNKEINLDDIEFVDITGISSRDVPHTYVGYTELSNKLNPVYKITFKLSDSLTKNSATLKCLKLISFAEFPWHDLRRQAITEVKPSEGAFTMWTNWSIL